MHYKKSFAGYHGHNSQEWEGGFATALSAAAAGRYDTLNLMESEGLLRPGTKLVLEEYENGEANLYWPEEDMNPVAGVWLAEEKVPMIGSF